MVINIRARETQYKDVDIELEDFINKLEEVLDFKGIRIKNGMIQEYKKVDYHNGTYDWEDILQASENQLKLYDAFTVIKNKLL